MSEGAERGVVCEAIRMRRLLFLSYGGHARIVEPYVHGRTSAGIEVLLCFQREGSTSSGYRSHWRALHLGRIEHADMLGVHFPFTRPEFAGRAAAGMT